MNNLDGYLISLGKEKLEKLIKEMLRIEDRRERMRFVFHHFGPYYLWNVGAYMLNGELVEIGFNPNADAYIGTYIINVYAEEMKKPLFEDLIDCLTKRIHKCTSVAEVKLLFQTELETLVKTAAQYESSNNPEHKAWLAGYYTEVLKTNITDIAPVNGMTCASAAYGSAERLLELVINDQLEELIEGEKVIDDNLVYSLGTHAEIVLYFKYSGLEEKLIEQFDQNDSALSRAICLITGIQNTESIRQVLIALKYSPKDPRFKKKITYDHINNTKQRLKATKLDTTAIERFLDEVE